MIASAEFPVSPILEAALAVAVPAWIWKIAADRWTHERRAERAKVCAQVIAEKGDVLQFGGKGCKDAFNALAEGLACAAFSPGGVRFGGSRWEAP